MRQNAGSGRRAIVLGRKQLEQRQGLTRRNLLSTFDKNGDGTIDPEERKMAQENLLKGLLIRPVDDEENTEESAVPTSSSEDIKT